MRQLIILVAISNLKQLKKNNKLQAYSTDWEVQMIKEIMTDIVKLKYIVDY